MSKRQHASDREGFVHQDYNSSKNRRFAKPDRSFTWKREPSAGDRTTKFPIASDPIAISVVKNPPARQSQRFAAHGSPQYDSGPHFYPPREYGASSIPSYGYGTHVYPSHGYGARYPRSCVFRDHYSHSYGSRGHYSRYYGSGDHYRRSYGSGDHYRRSYGSGDHYPPSLVSGPFYPPHSIGASNPPSYGVADPGHLSYSHDATTHSLPSHASGVHDFHFHGVGAKALSPKFPAVSLCKLPNNCSEADIIQFFDGLHIVDVIPIYTGETFARKAVVVFSNSAIADSALRRNKQKLGVASVVIDTCRRQDYYDAVAAAVNDGVDFRNTRAEAKFPDDKNVAEHTCDPNGNVVADSNYSLSPQCQAMRHIDSNVMNHTREQKSDAVADSKLHERPEAETETENLINNNHAMQTDCHDRIKLMGPGSQSHGRPKESSDKEPKVYTQILKLRNVPPSADMYDIIDFFTEFNLTLDRLQIVCRQDGIATGEVYVEFDSVEDANKAISKDKKMILTQCVELFPSSPNEASRAMSEPR